MESHAIRVVALDLVTVGLVVVFGVFIINPFLLIVIIIIILLLFFVSSR